MFQLMFQVNLAHLKTLNYADNKLDGSFSFVKFPCNRAEQLSSHGKLSPWQEKRIDVIFNVRLRLNSSF